MPLSASNEVIGQVIFVHGLASRLGPDGEQVVYSGDAVRAGDRLQTGSNGYVHLRFIDQAFVSLRPGARLHIRDYHVDPVDSHRHRVRFQLEQGVGRFITGSAGQAHKAGFRVNTPLAAIGIRGTDFVVSSSHDGTRALVNQGAIIMAPFMANCAMDAFGPCQTAWARELNASQARHYLDLGRQGPPRLRIRKRGAVDLLPLPMESRDGPSSAAPEHEASSSTLDARNQSGADASVGPVHADNLSWGRWTHDGDASLRGAGYELMARNEIFALYRGSQPLSLPSTGQFSFAPTYTEAYSQKSDGTRLPAGIINPRLSINFAEQTFATALTWRHGSESRIFEGNGVIDSRGVMQLDKGSRDMAYFYGVLSPEALSAAYIFEGDLADSRALGLVRWQRRNK